MSTHMNTPGPEDILAVDAAGIADFISYHAGLRTLSPMVRNLNDTLMGGDPVARRTAARALAHLGFIEHV